MVSAISAILEKCDIYFDNALVSRESIIEKYLSFFADSMNLKTRTIGFALHTGSVCFDVISVVAVGLGCLSHNLSSNDEIIAALQTDEMVMFNGKRYRWKGLEPMNGDMCMLIEQDGIGKNGPSKKWLKYDRYKHLITPYHGLSQTTDGRGVKGIKTNREDFLSHIFNLPISEIPIQIDISVVVVADRGLFADICKKVSIVYDNGKRVGLLDIIPASYYTSNRAEYQFGANPTKKLPVFKVTGNISTARDMVFDKHGNKVVGLLVFGDMILQSGFSELSDLLRRKTLKFAIVTSSMCAELSDHIFELHEEASVFACTKEFLGASFNSIRVNNLYTNDLHQQIEKIIENRVTPLKISGGLDKDAYFGIRNTLLAIKQSNWQSERKDEFIISAHGMLNLFNTAVFTMNEMEQAVVEGRINQAVKSPRVRISELWNIAVTAGAMQECCRFVVDALEQKYNELLIDNPKANILREYINEHSNDSIVVVVPKAYYSDILVGCTPELFASRYIVCVTPNRFDTCSEYDTVIVVGEINSKKFDFLRCFASKNIIVLLYDGEERVFAYRKQKRQKFEWRLNSELGIATKNLETFYNNLDIDKNEETDILSFTSLDEYIANYNFFDIHKIAVGNIQTNGYMPVSEVTHVGLFTTGEQILFSKHYSAVVYDAITSSITEKNPSDLLPGDVLVFTKRNDYTQNIVDIVYERLLESRHLSSQSVEIYEKSQYWKKVLRKYKDDNNYTYHDIAMKIREVGGLLQETTIGQWITEDSHIVGPRDEKTMEYIAKITQDPYLSDNTHDYYEACRIVRHERRKILKLIAMAINDKLKGFVPSVGSDLEVVYDNVERLSEELELEYISNLDESVNININLVNRPITEVEVLM